MLFLSAGTVIHAAHHEEDIRKVGGLAKTMKFTNVLFLIGALALIGTPGLAGSYSKDAILEGALHNTAHPWVFYALLFGAFITGAYSGRLYWGIFQGPEGEASKYAKAHATNLGAFDLPLIPLAVGAVGLGIFEALTHGISGAIKASVHHIPEIHAAPNALGLGVFAIGAVGFGAGIFLARLPQKGLPVPGGLLLDGLVGEFRGVPAGVASIHGGSVGRYLVISLIGAAMIAGLALRTPSTSAPVRLDGKTGTGDVKKSPRRDSATGKRPRTPPQLKKLQDAIRRGDLKRLRGGAGDKK